MKILKFQMKIMEIKKKNDHDANLRNSIENHEQYENHRIPIENLKTNHQNDMIPFENHEIRKIIEVHMIIMKIIKIKVFN